MGILRRKLSLAVIVGLVALAGGAIGYAIGTSRGSGRRTVTIGSSGGTQGQTTGTSAAGGGRIVLKGASNKIFPQRTFSGEYRVTWSYTKSAAAFISVDAKKKPSPVALGKTVVDSGANSGATFVRLNGDYYIQVTVGGKDYTVKFEPQ